MENLKQLETRYSQLNNSLNDYLIQQKELKEVISKIQSQRDKIKLKIDDIKNKKDLIVSEHAILRYLERVINIDTEEIKKDILSEELLSLVDKLGNTGKYPNKNYKVVIKNGIITTITN